MGNDVGQISDFFFQSDPEIYACSTVLMNLNNVKSVRYTTFYQHHLLIIEV